MAKRHKSASRPLHEASVTDIRSPLGADPDDGSIDTPPLTMSVPGSPLSMSSLSSMSSPEATPPPPERTLTQRQRKQLGLPKPRVVSASAKKSAGKIKIPGGRMRRAGAAESKAKAAKDDEEWQRNGTGRLDVRGFRELKI